MERGRGSFNSLPVEFGLGSATTIEQVSIRWPSGIVQRLFGVGMDQNLDVTEPCDDLTLLVESNALVWAQPSWSRDTRFDLVRGSLDLLRSTGGDFAAATLECLADQHTDRFLPYDAIPPVGGEWFLVREVTRTGNGTYDEMSGSQVGSRDAEIDVSFGGCP